MSRLTFAKAKHVKYFVWNKWTAIDINKIWSDRKVIRGNRRRWQPPFIGFDSIVRSAYAARHERCEMLWHSILTAVFGMTKISFHTFNCLMWCVPLIKELWLHAFYFHFIFSFLVLRMLIVLNFMTEIFGKTMNILQWLQCSVQAILIWNGLSAVLFYREREPTSSRKIYDCVPLTFPELNSNIFIIAHFNRWKPEKRNPHVT